MPKSPSEKGWQRISTASCKRRKLCPASMNVDRYDIVSAYRLDKLILMLTSGASGCRQARTRHANRHESGINGHESFEISYDA